MRIDMTTEEFFADNGETEFIDRLAAVLGIPSYRIRIVDSYRGSTVVVIFVNADQELEEQMGEGSPAVMDELSSIQDLILDIGNTEVEFPYDILDINTIIIDTGVPEEGQEQATPTVVVVSEGSEEDGEDEDNDSDSDTITISMAKTPAIILICITCVIMITMIAIIAYIILRRRKSNLSRIATFASTVDIGSKVQQSEWSVAFDGKTPQHNWGVPTDNPH